MNVYVIQRERGDYSWCDNYKAVVVAEDELHAERYARLHVDGWKKAKLYPPGEVNLEVEQIISVENTGA